MRSRRDSLLALLLLLLVCAGEGRADPTDTLWVIPHTHWEGAVFKTREEYLEAGLPHILHALELLERYPQYTFVLDQVAYVKPFLERYPEQEAAFRKFVREGRLELVLGMDVMPDVSKPGGESFVRQIQYGKGYYRRNLGVDVTTAWLVDTFGHHSQMPQLLRLGGYKSFWFFRGVPNAGHPAEFLWEGIDGSRIPAVWLPHGYGLFWGAPGTLPEFERFARQRFDALNANSAGAHDRAAPAGVDVSDPEDQLPAMIKLQQASGHDLGFKLRFGVPSQVDAAIATRTDLPVFKGELNPIFQGTYSSRIELKQAMRSMERLLTTAEKLGAIAGWLGGEAAPPSDRQKLWDAWEHVLFNETHDLASGVMTDHVYDDVQRELDFARRLGEALTDGAWGRLAAAMDTRGPDANPIPLVVFNSLGWQRTDVAQVTLGFSEPAVGGVIITEASGARVPAQIVSTVRGRDGGIREARVAFTAADVPAIGCRVYHAAPEIRAPGSPANPELLGDRPGATTATADRPEALLENEYYSVSIDRATGAIDRVTVKDGNWEALSGPGNVVARQEDKGDLWELYHGLDGGSRFAMTTRQPVPRSGPTTKLSTDFKPDPKAPPPVFVSGDVFSEFTVTHPFEDGRFATTVQLTKGSRRIEITTRLVNRAKLVRYQALFPTPIRGGRSVHAIPFGAAERPAGVEFPAQEWADYSDGQRGVALLNVGLPGNLVSEDTMMVSLLRSHTLGGYGFGGGYEPGMTSDSGYELGRERALSYALLPHAGDWRDARVYREGMEFAHPLICRKSAAHPGALGTRWGFLTVSAANVVVTSIQSGEDGAMLVRLYEAAGRPTPGVTLTPAADIASAAEVNLLGDAMAPLKSQGKSVTFDLGAFQIKTLSVKLAKPPG